VSILKDILYKVTIEAVHGSTDLPIEKIEFDSRKVSNNDVFVAIKGFLSDGHQFIDKAISLGASVVVCEDLPATLLENITYVKVQNSNQALSYLAANYYNNPSQKLKLIGITGTNGKTTIASLLFQMFKKAGYKVGLLSTVKIMVDEVEYKATHTTPDSLTINQYLDEMVEVGCEFCFMEVSSHGIHQKRTESLHFEGGVFTNLSHDHLDYHDTFAEYRDVKKSFFDNLPKSAFAITNVDDKNGVVMLQNTVARKRTYALKTYADFKAQVLENQLSGLVLKINNDEVWTKLIGSFNAYNLLAIYVATMIAVGLGVSGQVLADEALAKAKNCMSCHAVDKKLVGPSYKDVAAKYKGDAGAAEALAAKVKAGGKGVWGQIPMPPNNVTPEEAKKLATWVLSQK
jgi:UDP-N-acetylmuramoyl-L-alanyl-D-glutamate--2,6-diaminopimelate ligase